ncbi:MAG: PilZ domain-containing protein [Spirochaetaceae bacterium]|nr:PilZ domain-containing protein [Spirochaetaceae bacterium]
MDATALGKKVFFVNPHSVIENKLIQELINREYEVYLIKDHRKIESICEFFTDPVIFINIDEGLVESEWEILIRSLMEKESTRHSRIGIVTYNDNSLLSRKYLMDIMVPCGYIKLKLGLNDSTEIIIKTLEANEVKGKRRYVRATCHPDDAKFNVPISDRIEKGYIVDISSVGMAVQFESNLNLLKNSFLPDVQLKLKGILINISVVVLGFREIEGEKKTYLLMFDSRISKINKMKIRKYIHRTLQQNMERKLNFQYA